MPFLVRRLIGLLFVIFGVAFITFLMDYFSPGDPIKEMMGEHFKLKFYCLLLNMHISH